MDGIPLANLVPAGDLGSTRWKKVEQRGMRNNRESRCKNNACGAPVHLSIYTFRDELELGTFVTFRYSNISCIINNMYTNVTDTVSSNVIINNMNVIINNMYRLMILFPSTLRGNTIHAKEE